MSLKLTPGQRLAFALDVPTLETSDPFLNIDALGLVKVGLQLHTALGRSIVQYVLGKGRRLFLDLKLHDIPETVHLAAIEIARQGAHFTTVHACGADAMLRAAVQGVMEGAAERSGGPPTKVLGVTVLTSLDLADLARVGTEPQSVEELVVKRALLAQECGCDGVVASPQEARAIRRACGPDLLIVTPGVELTGKKIDRRDQKRKATIRDAILAGSDIVVVGRAIRDADVPEEAVYDCLVEIESAMEEREASL